jgi:hypothetical protein
LRVGPRRSSWINCVVRANSQPVGKEIKLAEFFRLGESIKGAILTIMRYIKHETGKEPTQQEVAALLNSYFIINEVGNQIKYLLKKGITVSGGNQIEFNGPFWKLNLLDGPDQNVLAKAGIFHRSIKEAIDGTRKYIQKTTGATPSNEIIAKSLKSSFILSEIKNQLEYQRKKYRIRKLRKKQRSSR